MFTYFWLTTLTIIGLVFLSLAVLAMAEEWKAIRDLRFSSIALVILFNIFGVLSLSPFGYFVANLPATTNEVSKLARLCPSIKEKIEARSEILKYREATEIYNQCIKDQELSEQVTLEKQKEAVKK